VAAALVTAFTIPTLAQDDDIPYDLRDDLEAVLEKKAGDLYESRDENGLRYQRGTYSKKFHKIDDATYQVTFTQDSATGDRLKTERFLLTLSKDGGTWKIADEELVGTYARMIREVPGDETYRKFDSFRYNGQGLDLEVTNGTLLIDYLDGEPDSILMDGTMKYAYQPPGDLGYHQKAALKEMIRRRDEDFVFVAELVSISCDAFSCKEFLQNNFTGLEEIDRSRLGGELARFYNEAEQDQRKDRKERVFSGFRLPLEPDRRFYSIFLKRNERDQWAGIRVDNDGPWEVQFVATGYGAIFGYMSDESREKGVAPYDDEARDDWDARYFELEAAKGTVELALEDSESLKADVMFTINFKRDTREIPFGVGGFQVGGKRISERNPTIVVDALETADGEELTRVLTGARSGYIILPEKAKAGDQMEIRLAFRNRGSIVKLTPSFAALDRGGWLPFSRFTDNIDRFEMTLKVPEKYTVLGVGTKMSEEVEDGVRITHWKAHNPVTFPTMIFGDYTSAKSKVKATKSDGTEIPVTIYVDKDSDADWGISGRSLVSLADQAANALNLYREIYGVDYPYGKLDLVADPANPVPYGQAPASIIYLGNGVFKNEAMWASIPGMVDAKYIARFLKTVVSHEVAHQWWGGVVGNANSRNYWFVESLAEYSSALWVEAVESDAGKKPEKGFRAYLDKTESWRRAVLQTDLVGSIQDSTSLWVGDPQGSGTSPYMACVYNKGPYAFHMLRMTFGTEKMDEFLRNLSQGLQYKEIYTRDIQRIAEETFGGTMEWFFDQWIRGAGIPEYGFNYTYRQTEDKNYLVEGSIRQRVVVGRSKEVLEDTYYRGVVNVTVVGRDKQEYSKRLIVEGAETPFRFKVPVEPLEIVMNKNGEMLAHDIIVNKPF
jgi:hypothetical protein